MKTILVFDCETNGKIKNFSLPPEVVDNYPRLSQLSYKIFNDKGELLKTFNEFVKPDGWDFPNEQFFIDNADINKNIEFGKPVVEVLDEYIIDRLAANYVVAHNINFDTKIIRSEMIRANIKVEFEAKKICTMMKSTSYAKVPKKSGKGYKWPSLTELHTFLFGAAFENAHDSSGDTDACAKCFFQLLERKVIILD